MASLAEQILLTKEIRKTQSETNSTASSSSLTRPAGGSSRGGVATGSSHLQDGGVSGSKTYRMAFYKSEPNVQPSNFFVKKMRINDYDPNYIPASTRNNVVLNRKLAQQNSLQVRESKSLTRTASKQHDTAAIRVSSTSDENRKKPLTQSKSNVSIYVEEPSPPPTNITVKPSTEDNRTDVKPKKEKKTKKSKVIDEDVTSASTTSATTTTTDTVIANSTSKQQDKIEDVEERKQNKQKNKDQSKKETISDNTAQQKQEEVLTAAVISSTIAATNDAEIASSSSEQKQTKNKSKNTEKQSKRSSSAVKQVDSEKNVTKIEVAAVAIEAKADVDKEEVREKSSSSSPPPPSIPKSRKPPTNKIPLHKQNGIDISKQKNDEDDDDNLKAIISQLEENFDNNMKELLNNGDETDNPADAKKSNSDVLKKMLSKEVQGSLNKFLTSTEYNDDFDRQLKQLNK